MTEAAARRADLLAGAGRAAVTAGVEREHELHSSQLLEEPERARVALRGVAARREELVSAVRVAAVAADAARRRIRADHEASEEAEAGVDSARQLLVAAESDIDGAISDLLGDVAAWSAEWAVVVPEPHVEAGDNLTARKGNSGTGCPASEGQGGSRSHQRGYQRIVV